MGRDLKKEICGFGRGAARGYLPLGQFRAGHEPTRKFAGPRSLGPCKVKLLRDGALLGRSQLLTPGLRWRNLQMVW